MSICLWLCSIFLCKIIEAFNPHTALGKKKGTTFYERKSASLNVIYNFPYSELMTV